MNEVYVTYKAKINDSLGKVMGPGRGGKRFVVTGQMYDPNTDSTVLELTPEADNDTD